MEHWDPQMMLNLYIHNYLIRKDMHTSAEIFAREANFYPRAVAINPPEGFLSEWWSLFWSVFSARFPKNTERIEGPSSKDTGNLLQSDLSTMMLSSVTKLPISDFSVMEGQAITNLIDARTQEQEPLGLHARDLSSGSQLLNADQLACMLGSSSNSSHPQEKVYNNPQLCFTGDIGTSLKRSIAIEPTRHSRKDFQFQIGPADTDSRMHEQERLWLPVRNLNSSSQILDVNAHFLPSSSNYCSHPLENVYMKPLLSVARDDEKFGTCMGISTSDVPTCYPPKTIQLRRELVDTDARMYESEHHRLPVLNSNSQLLDVDQLALLLPSPSNFSHPPKNKKRQHSVTRDDNIGSSLRRSTTANMTSHAPKVIQPKTEPSDAGIIREQLHLRRPIRDSNSNSQLLGAEQIACLLSSSINCSHPPKNVNKKTQHSINRVDSCPSSLRRSIVEPTRRVPKAIQRKTEPADGVIDT